MNTFIIVCFLFMHAAFGFLGLVFLTMWDDNVDRFRTAEQCMRQVWFIAVQFICIFIWIQALKFL